METTDRIGPIDALTAVLRLGETATCRRAHGQAIHDLHDFMCIPDWSRRLSMTIITVDSLRPAGWKASEEKTTIHIAAASRTV
ncbi:hypothetical protein [Novosphingobium sp.]|uniref:hypothetical protein n=1 Tax=Novosphingobium sp. TaxID=1874826 RepID=UPI002B4A802B|nr:hypothetical protein [Novosphingobium sp.]HKR93036.1 hypothetical protein [Novosphingobium sp.]